jgi:hypothetical protein
MLSKKKKHEISLEEHNKENPYKVNNIQNERMQMSKKANNLREETISEFADRYNQIISIDYIVKAIEIKSLKNKKTDRTILIAYIDSTLKSELESIAKKKSEELKKVIDDFIFRFEESVKNINLDFLGIRFTFNAKVAFASGLSGFTTIGGLAVWASTFGNLGAYILIAKGVSILTALGIPTGGTAAVISAVASMGGPIILGITLAIMAAASVFTISILGWKKSLAKQIVKAYDKEKGLEKYKQAIKQFWNATQKGIDSCADNMLKEWEEKADALRENIKSYDVHDLSLRIQAAKKMKDFFINIPLDFLRDSVASTTSISGFRLIARKIATFIRKFFGKLSFRKTLS